ncbi:MAG: hypothetical protein FWD70_01750 [Desulfuromonadales bacterium]|nr:hypothetical protein [Desulfuromonadales bacterium]
MKKILSSIFAAIIAVSFAGVCFADNITDINPAASARQEANAARTNAQQRANTARTNARKNANTARTNAQQRAKNRTTNAKKAASDRIDQATPSVLK